MDMAKSRKVDADSREERTRRGRIKSALVRAERVHSETVTVPQHLRLTAGQATVGRQSIGTLRRNRSAVSA